MVMLLIPTALRPFTDGQSSIEVGGATVGEAIAGLAEQYPDIKKHIYEDEGSLRSFINVYVGEDNVKDLQGLDTALADGVEVMIVPAIAGGCDA